MITWPGEHQGRFMVRMTDTPDPDASGYGFASVSDITNLCADNSYAVASDEDARDFQVWRLANDGPVPAKLTLIRHAPIGMVQVMVSWRVPVGGGKYEQRSESGYYPMIGS